MLLCFATRPRCVPFCLVASAFDSSGVDLATDLVQLSVAGDNLDWVVPGPAELRLQPQQGTQSVVAATVVSTSRHVAELTFPSLDAGHGTQLILSQVTGYDLSLQVPSTTPGLMSLGTPVVGTIVEPQPSGSGALVSCDAWVCRFPSPALLCAWPGRHVFQVAPV